MPTVFLKHFVLLFLANQVIQSHADNNHPGKCKFDQNEDHKAFKVLEKLAGTRLQTSSKKYTFNIGICDTADKSLVDVKSVYLTAGALQRDSENNIHVLGDYEHADFIMGNDWILLSYMEGETYSSYHCSGRGRIARVMISCDKGNTAGTLAFFEENTAKNDTCYYMFELKHDAVCPKVQYSLSPGSIICIVFFSLLAVYLIVGVIAQRALRGAKGWEQIPNYTFWRSFGNYAADGCNLVFRSSDTGSREYRGVSEDDINQEIPRQSSEPDDHLLSM